MQSSAVARILRRRMTEAEKRLWWHLRAGRLQGEKFRRQVPIGRYVVDFLHAASHLVIEADGSQHVQSTHDLERDAWLGNQGFRVLRLWNNDILQRTDAVLERILMEVREG